MPKFSVIIPVYKVEKYIRQCIESVLNQTYADFEILAVDDCGYDKSIEIVEEYANKDSRIRILYHEHNRGLSAARNTALDEACGEYIVCLDSDDWWEPDCLETIYNAFNKHKTNSIWFNSRKFIEDENRFLDELMYKQEDSFRDLRPDNMAAFADFTWIKAYTRESIQKHNLHWPEGLTFEDGEFYFKYFTHNPKTYVLSAPLYNYRVRESSIVYNANRGNLKMEHLYTVIKHLKEFWKELDVYNRYRITLLKLIQNRLQMCKNLNYSEENQIISYKFLSEIGWPDEFSDLNPQESDNKPLVSVIVPVYNVENYIKECLESIINQTYKNIEIICVDDCGQDNSVKIAEEFAQKDARIKIIHHKENRGLGGARNTGLDNAQGKYIFFVDSDDYIDKECISITVDKLKETNLNAVFFKADVWWENKKERTPIWFKNYADAKEGYLTIDETNICSLPHYTWNKGYNREFLIKNNIRWQENVIYEDVEFFFRLFTKSPETYMIDRALYIYRRHDKSIIGQVYGNQTHAEDLYEVVKRVRNYLVENNFMPKYENEYLHLVTNIINNYRNTPKTHNALIPMMKKFLDDINFPEEYTIK